jgi:hypothetical protein
MSIEILLDILVSVLFLAIYHSDIAPSPLVEFHSIGVICTPESYDLTGAIVAPVSDWVLDDLEPIAGPVPDSLIGSIGEALGIVQVVEKSPISPTVKQLRVAAKLLGVKNGSRMSKTQLELAIGGAMLEATISELPIDDTLVLDLSENGLTIA